MTISCYPSYSFTVTLTKRNKTANMEYEIDAHTEKEAYEMMHLAVKKDFPDAYIVGISVCRLSNKR